MAWDDPGRKKNGNRVIHLDNGAYTNKHGEPLTACGQGDFAERDGQRVRVSNRQRTDRPENVTCKNCQVLI